MTTPVNQLPLPPVPSQQNMLVGNSTLFISQPWNQWFIQLKTKIDVINNLLVTIAGYGTTTNLFNNISPLTTQGDMLVYAGGVNTRLPIGTDGQILTTSGGFPTWVDSSGLAPTITAIADTNLTYPCIVAIVNGHAHYADPTNVTDMASLLAITTQSALTGTTVICSQQLSHTEISWSWLPGRIYLSTTPGQLTQTLGSSGAILEVGRAVSSTTIYFSIQTALLR